MTTNAFQTQGDLVANDASARSDNITKMSPLMSPTRSRAAKERTVHNRRISTDGIISAVCVTPPSRNELPTFANVAFQNATASYTAGSRASFAVDMTTIDGVFFHTSDDGEMRHDCA